MNLFNWTPTLVGMIWVPTECDVNNLSQINIQGPSDHKSAWWCILNKTCNKNQEVQMNRFNVLPFWLSTWMNGNLHKHFDQDSERWFNLNWSLPLGQSNFRDPPPPLGGQFLFVYLLLSVYDNDQKVVNLLGSSQPKNYILFFDFLFHFLMCSLFLFSIYKNLGFTINICS